MGLRLLKVNEGVKEVVSAVIAEGLKDPRVGFVTVTGVETSRDLRHAKVFFSVLGGAARARRDAWKALVASHGYLQARVNAALRMKRTPQLVFVYDETIDQAQRIEHLIRREAEVLGEEPPVQRRRGRRDERRSERALEDRPPRSGRGAREGPGRRPRRRLPAHARRERVALAVHEKPDLDALGAAAGMLDLFGQLGAGGDAVRRRR